MTRVTPGKVSYARKSAVGAAPGDADGDHRPDLLLSVRDSTHRYCGEAHPCFDLTDRVHAADGDAVITDVRPDSVSWVRHMPDHDGDGWGYDSAAMHHEDAVPMTFAGDAGLDRGIGIPDTVPPGAPWPEMGS